jgi:hypothetical protein
MPCCKWRSLNNRTHWLVCVVAIWQQARVTFCSVVSVTISASWNVDIALFFNFPENPRVGSSKHMRNKLNIQLNLGHSEPTDTSSPCIGSLLCMCKVKPKGEGFTRHKNPKPQEFLFFKKLVSHDTQWISHDTQWTLSICVSLETKLKTIALHFKKHIAHVYGHYPCKNPCLWALCFFICPPV